MQYPETGMINRRELQTVVLRYDTVDADSLTETRVTTIVQFKTKHSWVIVLEQRH